MKFLATLLFVLFTVSLYGQGNRNINDQFDPGKFNSEKIKELKEKFSKIQGNKVKATEADVAYGSHERNKLDLWQAKSSKPTPVLVYFHGGGFKFGDKRMIHFQIPVKDYMDNDVSCISVNYPFLQHTNNDINKILEHCENAIEFIIKNASKWNIDPKRISLAGASAGAMISQNLGHTTKYIHSLAAFNQPMMTDKMIVPKITKSSPPIYIYHDNDVNDRMHPPQCAKMVEQAYKKKNLECHVYGTGKNTLDKIPGGKTPEAAILEYFLTKWK